jgi:hypothetical protein
LRRIGIYYVQEVREKPLKRKGVLRMKFKATKKEMKANYHHIIRVPYCAAQNMLKFSEPIAYSTRAEGWACDYYDIDGVLISTGYAPLDSKNAYTNYKTTRKYDDMAREVMEREEVENILKAYVSECTTGDGQY